MFPVIHCVMFLPVISAEQVFPCNFQKKSFLFIFTLGFSFSFFCPISFSIWEEIRKLQYEKSHYLMLVLIYISRFIFFLALLFLRAFLWLCVQKSPWWCLGNSCIMLKFLTVLGHMQSKSLNLSSIPAFFNYIF